MRTVYIYIYMYVNVHVFACTYAYVHTVCTYVHACLLYAHTYTYVHYMLTCVIASISRSPMILYRRHDQPAEGAAEATGKQNGPVC